MGKIERRQEQMKKGMFLSVIGLGLLLPGILLAQVQVKEEWVARYNGTGNLYDRATAIAVDTSGNVYVTGQSVNFTTVPYDYAIVSVKYNSIGTQIWSAIYNGPGYDEASAIAVDSSGNIYVTGVSYGIGTDYDYLTVKYDTNGNEIWVARYNNGSNDYPNTIVVDSSGNVYVTGASQGEYTTVKYDTNGNQLWETRYSVVWFGQNSATDIALDLSGNIYVTGESWRGGIPSTSDYATIKYDTNGNEVWVTRYNGPVNDVDRANAIAVDSSGNVYVTGLSLGITTSADYTTVKYDTNGNELWVSRYDGPGNELDYATDIVIDSSGNIYVTGSSVGIPGTLVTDYATIKYDINGNELWTKRYNGLGDYIDEARAIEVDLSGNVYVTGISVGPGTGYDYTTVKYDTNGNEIWVERYHEVLFDRAFDIAIDLSGNVYVTGGSDGRYTFEDYATIKYCQNCGIGETPVGTNVTVDLGNGVTLTFSNVTVAGETTLTITDTGPPPLAGFKLAGKYYEISTTALYTGPVIVEIIYDDTGMTAGQEKTLKLFHLESGVWVNVTTSLDTVNNIITGQVASLSLFAIMFEAGPPGWDEGNKTGWENENTPHGLIKNKKTPEGFDNGKKSGWAK